MPATITNADGSLNFVAAVDTSDVDTMSRRIEKQLEEIVAATERANTAVSSTNNAITQSFDDTRLKQYSDQVVKLYNSVSTFLQDSFGFEKLQALDGILNKATTDAEHLSLVLQFFKENASDINSNNESARVFIENVENLQKSLQLVNETKVSENLEKADDKAKELNQSVQGLGESITKGAITPLGELTQQFHDLNAKADQLEKSLSLEKDPAAIQRLNAELSEVGHRLDVVQAQLQAVNNPNYGNVTAISTEVDIDTSSVDQLRDKLVELKDHAERLKEALNLGTDEATGRLYNEQLSETRALIQQVTERIVSMGGETESVYSKLRELREQLINLQPGDAGYDQLLQQAAELQDRINGVRSDISDFNSDTENAQSRLNEIRNLLANMSPDDSGYQPLLEEAAELQNRIQSVRQEVNLLGRNNSGTEALKQGINGVVGAFASASSAIALFTGDENKLQETMVKLFAVLQIVAGAEQFLGLVSRQSAANQYLLATYRRLTGQVTAQQAVATEAATVAEGANAVATEGAAIAQWNLNAAMEANPVGAVIIALTALIGIVSLYVSSLEDVDEKQVQVNESIAQSVELLEQLAELQNQTYSDRVQDAQNALTLAQSQGKSEREILDLKIKANMAASSAANEMIGFLGMDKQQLGLLEAKLELRKQEALSLISFQEISGKLTDKEQKRLDVLQSQVKAIEAQTTAARKAITAVDNSNQKAAELNAEKARQQKESAIRSSTAYAEVGVINAVPGSSAELEKQIAAINARSRAELTNVNLTNGEIVKIRSKAEKDIDELKRKYRIAQIADEEAAAKAVLAASIAGSTDEFNARASLIDLEAKKQLELEGLSQNRRRQIDNEREKAQVELAKKFNYDTAQVAIGQQIADTNTKISLSKKWSDAELQLRKDLVDQQANLDIAGAVNSIKNAELLSAKERQIYAQSLVEKKKLDDQYADRRLQSELNAIKINAEQANVQYEKILNSPAANPKERYTAQRKILETQQTALLQMWLKADQAAKNSTGNTEKYTQEAARLKKELIETGNAIENLDAGYLVEFFQQVSGLLQQLGGSVSELGSSLGQLNPELGNTVSGIGDLLAQAGNLNKMFSAGTSNVDKYSTALQSAVGLITLVTNAAAQRALSEREFNQGLISQQSQYNLALNEAILLNAKLKDNIFLVNFQGQLRSGILALADAQKKYQESIKALSTGEAKSGQRNSISGSAVLQGAGMGAVAGATLGPIGAAVGAVVGGLVGLFAGKKKTDSYVSLLMEYPELVKKTDEGILEINKDLAKTLINNKLVSDSTKVLIQDTLDWQEAIDKANAQIKDIISELAGDLGGDLRNSLVDAFEQGTDSALAFAKSVEKTLSNVLSQMIFNNVFGSAFDDLQKKMVDSFKANGDNKWEDDLTAFFNNYVGLSNEFNEKLQQAKDAAERAGLSVFQNPNKNEDNTLKGAIKGITEQQAELLAGQFGGLRITAMQQLQIMNQNLSVLNAIKIDTANLFDIKADIRKLSTTGVKLIK